ncbi:MAG: ureidoglycolate lyase [Nitratireductor sp.]
MPKTIIAKPITKDLFAPFGDVIDKQESNNFLINNGNCTRHHALTNVEIEDQNGWPIISIFSAKAYSLPLSLSLVERHPLGSQAFMPMHNDPFLVIVAKDNNGTPQEPMAFITQPNQGINFKPNTWHGVLTPIITDSDFLVVDRGGKPEHGNNLEEHTFNEPYLIKTG